MEALLQRYPITKEAPPDPKRKKLSHRLSKDGRRRSLDILEIVQDVGILKEGIVRIQNELESLSNSNTKTTALESLLLTNKDERSLCISMRLQFCDAVKKTLIELFPHFSAVSLRLFGSSVSDTCLSNSDIDIIVIIPGVDAPTLFSSLQLAISRCFSTSSTLCVEKLNATIPVMCVSDLNYEGTSWMVDFTKGDATSIKHAQQIQEWTIHHLGTEKHNKLNMICKVVKAWSKANELNSPPMGSLPSVAFIVLFLTILQQLNVFMTTGECTSVPLLNQMVQTLQNDQEDKEFVNGNLLAIQLLAFFLAFVLLDNNQCVRTYDCVGNNSPAHVDALKERWPDRNHKGFGRTCFIQDPFLEHVNLGRFVTQKSVQIIQKAMKKGFLHLVCTSTQILPSLVGLSDSESLLNP